MEGRQYRGYYRGATKQVNQAVEAIHLQRSGPTPP